MIQSSFVSENIEKIEKAPKKKDAQLEQKIRPSRLEEIIGRKQEKRTLLMMIESAKKRKEVIDHILFYGPQD